jgi:hypothetical protein
VSAGKVEKQINQVVDLLSRIEADKYFEELHKPFWKKYGKPKMISGKPNERGSIPVTIKYPKETPQNRARIGREALRLGKEEHRLRARDLEKALGLMLKNIWSWWD